MLRIIFVSTILIIGGILALQSAFNALLLYLWIAYFRPEDWVWTQFFYLVPTSFAVGVYLLFRSAFSGVRFRFDFRVAVLAALLIVGTISTFTSDHFEFSSVYLKDFAKTLVVSYLIPVTDDGPQETAASVSGDLSVAGIRVGQAGMGTARPEPGRNEYQHRVLHGRQQRCRGRYADAGPHAHRAGANSVQAMGALGPLLSGRRHRLSRHLSNVPSRGGFLALAALGLMF